MVGLCSSCTQKVCPTYTQNDYNKKRTQYNHFVMVEDGCHVKVNKKKSQKKEKYNDWVWNKDQCKAKPKKYKR